MECASDGLDVGVGLRLVVDAEPGNLERLAEKCPVPGPLVVAKSGFNPGDSRRPGLADRRAFSLSARNSGLSTSLRIASWLGLSLAFKGIRNEAASLILALPSWAIVGPGLTDRQTS